MGRSNTPTIEQIYLDIYGHYYVLLTDKTVFRLDPFFIPIQAEKSPKFLGANRYEFDEHHWYIGQKVISIGDIRKYGFQATSNKDYSSVRILIGQGVFQLRGTTVRGKFCYQPFKENEPIELAWGDGDPMHGGWNGIAVSFERLRNSKIFNQQLRASQGSWLIELLLSGGTDQEAIDQLHAIYYRQMAINCRYAPSS